jgi:hypothetical protein
MIKWTAAKYQGYAISEEWRYKLKNKDCEMGCCVSSRGGVTRVTRCRLEYKIFSFYL